MQFKFLNKTFILIILISLSSIACQKKTSEFHDDFVIFGTAINITLLDIDEKLAIECFRQIRTDLKVMHRVWHVWEPSPLMRMNTLIEYKSEFSAAPSVLDLLVVAKELSIQSQNLFNPAIGKLIALWGFHSHQRPETPPAKKDINKLLKLNPTMQDIKITGHRMISNNAAVKIDLGGIAKGFAIDRLLQMLKQKGVRHALINTGGDLKVIGQHGTRAWKVAIRDPRAQFNKQNIVASLDVMDNEAVFTSGDYERYLKNKNKNDKHLHHIIDPRTGYPATGTQSITVLHKNAATADAAATALFIAGPKEWVKIAKSMEIKHVLLIDEEGNLHISSAMQKRVKLEQQRKIVEIAEL